MAKSKNAVSKKTATPKKILENKESKQILKTASQFVRDISEQAHKNINRSLGILDGFKEYAIHWEAKALAADETFNLKSKIADFRNWIYKDNNFLLPNEIITKEDSVAMEKLKNSKEEIERLNFNRLSSSELPPQLIRDIFSKIQSIPRLIESGVYDSVRDANSINQIKTLKAELNKQERTNREAAQRLRVLGDVYESKRHSMEASLKFFDGIVDELLKVFKDDTEARASAAKIVVSIEKKIRKSQQDLNGYFLTRIAGMDSDDTRLLSHKDHIKAAASRHQVWEANKSINKLSAASNREAKTTKKATK